MEPLKKTAGGREVFYGSHHFSAGLSQEDDFF